MAGLGRLPIYKCRLCTHCGYQGKVQHLVGMGSLPTSDAAQHPTSTRSIPAKDGPYQPLIGSGHAATQLPYCGRLISSRPSY